MNKSPASVIAAAFISGILLARFTNIPFVILWITSVSALTTGALFIKSEIKFFSYAVFSVIFLGAAVFRSCQQIPPLDISKLALHGKRAVCVEGVVASSPVIKKRYTGFIFSVGRARLSAPNGSGGADRPAGRGICGKIFVEALGSKRFCYGDRLSIEGRICRVPYFSISKRLNYRTYLRRKGIYAVLKAGKNSRIRVIQKGQGNPLKALAVYVRRRIQEKIKKNMSPFSAGILSAVILGERYNLPGYLRDMMVQSGTVHIIAISGLHVGLVSFIFLMILRIARLPRKLCYFFTALLLILYCVMTGARTPVVRVTLMAVIFFTGLLIDRRINIYNMLSIAAIVILSYNPYQLFDVSFQLSFASILSIVSLAPCIKNIFPVYVRPHTRALISLFSCSLAAWLGLMPLIAYYFNIITPVAIIANMIVIPYLSIVIGAAFLAVTAAFVLPPTAHIFFTASEASVVFLVKLIVFFAHLPASYFYARDIPVPFILLYYLILATMPITDAIFRLKRRKGC